VKNAFTEEDCRRLMESHRLTPQVARFILEAADRHGVTYSPDVQRVLWETGAIRSKAMDAMANPGRPAVQERSPMKFSTLKAYLDAKLGRVQHAELLTHSVLWTGLERGTFTADDVREEITAAGLSLENIVGQNDVGMAFRLMVSMNFIRTVGMEASRRESRRGNRVYRYELTEVGRGAGHLAFTRRTAPAGPAPAASGPIAGELFA